MTKSDIVANAALDLIYFEHYVSLYCIKANADNQV
jgi:hypothetical protein